MSHPGHDPARLLGGVVAKSTPPGVVTLWTWMTGNLPTVVALATLVYIALQIAYLLWRWVREVRQRRAAEIDTP
jgi:membrane protein implicated in regulation of membrane protease activity